MSFKTLHRGESFLKIISSEKNQTFHKCGGWVSSKFLFSFFSSSSISDLGISNLERKSAEVIGIYKYSL